MDLRKWRGIPGRDFFPLSVSVSASGIDIARAARTILAGPCVQVVMELNCKLDPVAAEIKFPAIPALRQIRS